MGLRAAALVLVVALTACSRAPATIPAVGVSMSLRPVASSITPSPLMEIQVGDVLGVFPRNWTATMLTADRYPRQGFAASPRIDDWVRGTKGTQGIEAFWVDVDDLGISSDYYYLAARNAAFGQLPGAKVCGAFRQRVFANHPPDFSGATFSRSDYVASASGVCARAEGAPLRWAYVVAAPGFGPTRQIGIPTSGLYVLMAEVAGPNAETLLQEMLQRARFGNTSISELITAARRGQAH